MGRKKHPHPYLMTMNKSIVEQQNNAVHMTNTQHRDIYYMILVSYLWHDSHSKN